MDRANRQIFFIWSLVALLLTGCLQQEETAVSLGTEFYAGVTLNRQTTQPSPTRIDTIYFDVVFASEIEPDSFTVDDIDDLGDQAVERWALKGGEDGRTFLLTAYMKSDFSYGPAPMQKDRPWDVFSSGSERVAPLVRAGSVRMKNGHHNAASTGVDNVVIFDPRDPKAPRSLTLSPQTPSIDRSDRPTPPALEWIDSDDDDVDFYQAQIVAAENQEIIKGWTAIEKGKFLEVDGLQWDRTYKYLLRAVDRAGNVSLPAESPLWHVEILGFTWLEPLGLPPAATAPQVGCQSENMILINQRLVGGENHWMSYENTGNGWVQTQRILPIPGQDYSPISCQIRGNHFVIRGESRFLIMDRDPFSGHFTENVYKTFAGHGQVAFLDEDTVAVGGFDEATQIGQVRIYKFRGLAQNIFGAEGWNLEQTLTQGQAGDLFGLSLTYLDGRLHILAGGLAEPQMYSYEESNGEWVLREEWTPGLGPLNASKMVAAESDLLILTNTKFSRFRFENGRWGEILNRSVNLPIYLYSTPEMVYDQGQVLFPDAPLLFKLYRFTNNGTDLEMVRDYEDIVLSPFQLSFGRLLYSNYVRAALTNL